MIKLLDPRILIIAGSLLFTPVTKNTGSQDIQSGVVLSCSNILSREPSINDWIMTFEENFKDTSDSTIIRHKIVLDLELQEFFTKYPDNKDSTFFREVKSQHTQRNIHIDNSNMSPDEKRREKRISDIQTIAAFIVILYRWNIQYMKNLRWWCIENGNVT